MVGRNYPAIRHCPRRGYLFALHSRSPNIPETKTFVHGIYDAIIGNGSNCVDVTESSQRRFPSNEAFV